MGGILMFHPYKKDSSYLRTAIFNSYKEKCAYCGRTIQQREMHIDHIIPSNMGFCHDDEVNQYLQELEDMDFIRDCIENYLPSCPPCNLEKSNRVYTALNLRSFHEKARSHVADILKRIEALKSKGEEYYYEPIDLAFWEILDFSYQRDISHAIMGYRLTPADVEACPRFPQVERMSKQLSIVDHVVLQGQTGCGKSISVYQTAYDFYKQGWRVYRYKLTDSISVPKIPQNTEPSLYIIDDAQLLSNKAMEMLTEQARPHAKIIFAKTVTHTVQADTVLLTNSDAVKILYHDFSKRKDEILPIVNQCDKRIGVSFMDSRIEWRLQDAKEALTPWQFNYTLRGGWQTIKEQYQTIAAYHNCGLLAATIAAFQIMKLDDCVDYRWLCRWAQEIDDTLIWDDNDLRYLIGQKVVLSEDNVRIVHLESAKVIVAQYLENTGKDNILLKYIIEKAFSEKRVVPLGLVWLCNGIRSYTWNRYDQWLISEDMIASALTDIQTIEESNARMGITFFMEKVFSMSYERNGHWYFQKNKQTLLEWVERADSETAYSYSYLINTVYNTSHDEHKAFVDLVNWNVLFSSLDDEKNPNLYAWGELLNRLTAFFPRGEKMIFADSLHSTIDQLVEKASVDSIGGLSNFLSSIVHLSPKYVHNVVRKLTPVYHDFFSQNMIRATEIFDFDFLGYICGMSLLGGHRATKEEQQTAVTLVGAIPEDKFANAISNAYPRDWKRLHEILYLIGKYDSKKVTKIISLVDLAKITEMAKDSWDKPYDIFHLCIPLAMGSKATARHFIENNRERIRIVYSPFVMIAPHFAVEMFRAGTPVDLMTEHWWECSYRALRELIKVDAVSTKEILCENLSAIAERMDSISTYYMEETYCLKFMQLVCDFDQHIFDELLKQINLEKLKISWEKSYIHSHQKKHVEQRYNQLLNLLIK